MHRLLDKRGYKVAVFMTNWNSNTNATGMWRKKEEVYVKNCREVSFLYFVFELNYTVITKCHFKLSENLDK